MGIFGSSEERVEEKTVDTSGHVNNNIIIQEAEDTHNQLILNEKIFYASCLLVIFEAIKLIVYIVGAYKRKLIKSLTGETPRKK